MASNQSQLKGGPAGSGTIDTKVDRIEEGSIGIANLDNLTPTLATETRAQFDAGLATGIERYPAQNMQTLDTTRTNGLDDSASLRASAPTAGL